jgi:hypothetical protein
VTNSYAPDFIASIAASVDKSGHDNNWKGSIYLLDLVEKFKPGIIRQIDIEHDQRKLRIGKLKQCLSARRGDFHFIIKIIETFSQSRHDLRIVIDDQDRFLVHTPQFPGTRSHPGC